MFGQKENQSGKEESGSHLPAGSLVRREPSGQSPPGTCCSGIASIAPVPVNTCGTSLQVMWLSTFLSSP